MNRHINTAAISAVMIVFSIMATGIAEAHGDSAELGDDSFTRGYIGITLGEARWDITTLKTAPLVEVDNDDFAYGIVAGYRQNKFLGFELVGNYFGEPEYTNVLTSMDVMIYNAGLGANFYLPFGEMINDPNLNFISFLVRGGMHYWNADGEDSGVVRFEDSGVDPFWSFGLNLDLASHLALRGEHTTYAIGDTDKVSTMAFTLILKF